MRTSQWRRGVENRCVFTARLMALSDRAGDCSAWHWSKIAIIVPGPCRNIAVTLGMEQELSYRKQIARQLCAQYVESIWLHDLKV